MFSSVTTNTCRNCEPPVGAVTVMLAVPVLPSLAALIVAEPIVTPETSPELLTVATDVLLLDQVTVRPESVLPFASLSVVVS